MDQPDFETSNGVTLFSLIGNQLYDSKINSTLTKIDLSNYPSGVYFLAVTIDGKSQIHKILKEQVAPEVQLSIIGCFSDKLRTSLASSHIYFSLLGVHGQNCCQYVLLNQLPRKQMQPTRTTLIEFRHDASFLTTAESLKKQNFLPRRTPPKAKPLQGLKALEGVSQMFFLYILVYGK